LATDNNNNNTPKYEGKAGKNNYFDGESHFAEDLMERS